MQIDLVEDNDAVAAQMMALLPTLSTPSRPLTGRRFSTANQWLFQWPDRRPDLLLLDIKLPDMDGMALARQIRQTDAALPLAFVSNYDDYVFAGYDVNALGYIMKPLTKDKLVKLLAKVPVTANVPQLVLTTTAGQVVLEQYAIQYLEVTGHTVTVHSQDHSPVMTTAQLKDLQPLLTSDFIQCYRSIIVNLNFVSELTHTGLTMNDGSTLPVSRHQRRAVQAAFITHFRGLANADD